MQSTQPTVFLVDDDEATARGVTALLSSLRVNIEVFYSAESFLHAYDGRRGCILMDLRLPGMSGLDLQERLIDEGSTLPIVLMSGYADTQTVTKAMTNGAVEVLHKPCSGDELCGAVRHALSYLDVT